MSETVNVHLLNGRTLIFKGVTHRFAEGCFFVGSEGQTEWQRAFSLVNIRSVSWKSKTNYGSSEEDEDEEIL